MNFRISTAIESMIICAFIFISSFGIVCANYYYGTIFGLVITTSIISVLALIQAYEDFTLERKRKAVEIKCNLMYDTLYKLDIHTRE